jgi:uncharacterized protein YkwD
MFAMGVGRKLEYGGKHVVIGWGMPHMKALLKICIGATFLVTFAVSRPVLSAPPVAHDNSERDDVQRSARVATLSSGAARSVFLPLEEGRLLSLTNRERAVRGLPPLLLNVSLRETARAHARDMALWGYVGHTSRYGLGVRDRMALYLRPGLRIGENLAFVQTVEQGHLAFVGSWSHRQNILNPVFRRVGIGVATMGGSGIMIAEDFTDFAGPRPQLPSHRAWPIHSDNRTSSASTAPITRSRSAR